MKIGNYNITLKNIKSFIVGNSRYLLDKFGPNFLRMPDYLKEQMIERYSNIKQECKDLEYCINCKCPIKRKIYDDSECEYGCYDKFLNKEDWEKLKKESKDE